VENLKSQEVDYAYAVIDAVVEGMDKVAANPELAESFVVDMLKKMPEIIDALMALTPDEHKEIIGKLVRASSRMVGEWLKAKKMQ
jgi:hypothetical protein